MPETSSPIRNQALTELLATLPGLVHKSAREKFLARHPELSNLESVAWLSDLVRDQSKVDTATAIPLAQLAMMIASKFRDRSAAARSFRAMGNALYISGDNKSAVAYHERARRTFAALHDRKELARTLSASTQPLILTGNYRRALSNAKQARRILSDLGDRVRVARLDVNIGNIFHRQDRFAEALRWYRRAHHYFRTNVDADAEGIGVVLHNIAMCLVSLNDFHGALAAYQEAREIAEKHGLHVVVGQADYNIASLYHLRGQHSRAIRMLLSTRLSCRKTNDNYHVALCNLDLSEIYLQLNLVIPAEEMAKEASGGFEQLGMGYEAGKSMVNLALAMARQNKKKPALGMLKDARRRFIKEKNTAWPFLTDLYQAAILIEQGRYDEAQQLGLTAKRFFDRADIPSQIVQCELLLARSYLLSGKSRAAQRQCLSALATLRTVELPLLSCRAHQLMGQISLAVGSRHDAYSHYQEARRLLEKTRSNLRHEEMKISFMDDKLEIYEGLIRLCLDGKPEAINLDEAFEYVEGSKSRVLQDLMSSSEADVTVADNEDQRTAMSLRAQINWFSNRLMQEQLRGRDASPKAMDELQATIRKCEKEMLRLQREMPISGGSSDELSPSKPATVSEVRESLASNSTLVEYFQIQRRLFAALVARDKFEILPVTEMQLITPLLEKLQFQMGKFQLGAQYLDTFGESILQATQQHLQELHNLLISPLEGRLKSQHLVIVPHGPLHRLPFQALFDGREYLIDKFSLSYAPSATIHTICYKRPFNSKGPALVMGVPDAAAPLIGDEAKEVAGILSDALLFLNETASVEELRVRGPACRFIHISTHGYFRQDSPMFSGIRFTDSVLSLMDLYRMKLPAELVTLSGCATGASAIGRGDELLGLVRGLIYAGARAALLSLWDVNDKSTLEFMGSFYRHLAGGANKAAALQSAAKSLRKSYPHPYYWAAFSLVGNITS